MKNIYEGLDIHKDPNQRDFMTWGIFGTLGQGKSTFVKQFCIMYQKLTAADRKVPLKILILDPSKAGSYNDFAEISISELQFGVLNVKTGNRHRWVKGIRVLRAADFVGSFDWCKIINDHFTNGLLIMDEARDYISNSGSLPAQLKDLFTKHRNACIDLVVVSHNLNAMHKWIRMQIANFIIFPTGDVIASEREIIDMEFPAKLYKIYLQIQRDLANDNLRAKTERNSRKYRIQKGYILTKDGLIGDFDPEKYDTKQK